MSQIDTPPRAAVIEDMEVSGRTPPDDRLHAAARTLPRRRFFDDMPDKGLFALVALVGFAAIILLKTNTRIASEIIGGTGGRWDAALWLRGIPIAYGPDSAGSSRRQ